MEDLRRPVVEAWIEEVNTRALKKRNGKLRTWFKKLYSMKANRH